MSASLNLLPARAAARKPKAPRSGALAERRSHVWHKDPLGHYVEEPWVSERLFAVENFVGNIFDPCCGFGHIVKSAIECGFINAWGRDIERRWLGISGIEDFLEGDAIFENIVCNPPFDKIEAFTKQAVERSDRKAALIFPMRRLNAAGAWLQTLPLVQIWYLTPRPSMPPGHVYKQLEEAGKRPSGGTQDFCWIIFQKGFVGQPKVGWLHRDGAAT
jgi:hypothetical protein